MTARPHRRRRRARTIGGSCTCAALLAMLAASACKREAPEQGPPAGPSASSPAAGLSPELAGKVLAKVGDREITLGEYAATLERMDQFERLRYQTPDRRRKLLDEIINAELLANEARRRGLDKAPETQLRIRQALRDELLEHTRAALPPADQIPESEVRAYYDSHRDEFREPERRRVSHIVLSNEAKARQVLARARGASAADWGKLVHEHSLDKAGKPGPLAPLELAGDLGIISKPGEPRGDNPSVPEPVRKAVFEIDALGGVHPELVKDGARFHIVRLTGKTDARERSYVEAERAIRLAILQQRMRRAEQELDQQLKQRFPIQIDEEALKTVAVPAAPAQQNQPAKHDVPGTRAAPP